MNITKLVFYFFSFGCFGLSNIALAAETALTITPIKHYYWIQVDQSLEYRVCWQDKILRKHPVFLETDNGKIFKSQTNNQGIVHIRIPHIDKKMFQHRYDYVALSLWTKKKDPLSQKIYKTKKILKVHPQRYGGKYWKDMRWAVVIISIALLFLGWCLKNKQEEMV